MGKISYEAKIGSQSLSGFFKAETVEAVEVKEA